jgi:hypothetical protein
MRKLTLKLEELEVDSFETAAGEGEAGTVLAHATGRACPDTVEDYTCGVWCPPSQNPQDTEPCLC